MRASTAIVVLATFAAGCSQQPAPIQRIVLGTILDKVTIGETELVLVDQEKTCVLQFGTTQLQVKPQVPCFFLRRAGKVQQFTYADAGVDWVVVVAGTPMTEPDRTKWNIDPGAVCGSQTQGVLSKKGKLEVTTAVHAGGAYCRELGVDEKDFYSFAHGR